MRYCTLQNKKLQHMCGNATYDFSSSFWSMACIYNCNENMLKIINPVTIFKG